MTGGLIAALMSLDETCHTGDVESLDEWACGESTSEWYTYSGAWINGFRRRAADARTKIGMNVCARVCVCLS